MDQYTENCRHLETWARPQTAFSFSRPPYKFARGLTSLVPATVTRANIGFHRSHHCTVWPKLQSPLSHVLGYSKHTIFLALLSVHKRALQSAALECVEWSHADGLDPKPLSGLIASSTVFHNGLWIPAGHCIAHMNLAFVSKRPGSTKWSVQCSRFQNSSKKYFSRKFNSGWRVRIEGAPASWQWTGRSLHERTSGAVVRKTHRLLVAPFAVRWVLAKKYTQPERGTLLSLSIPCSLLWENVSDSCHWMFPCFDVQYVGRFSCGVLSVSSGLYFCSVAELVLFKAIKISCLGCEFVTINLVETGPWNFTGENFRNRKMNQYCGLQYFLTVCCRFYSCWSPIDDQALHCGPLFRLVHFCAECVAFEASWLRKHNNCGCYLPCCTKQFTGRGRFSSASGHSDQFATLLFFSLAIMSTTYPIDLHFWILNFCVWSFRTWSSNVLQLGGWSEEFITSCAQFFPVY